MARHLDVGKTEFVVIDGDLTAQRYREEILQPTAVPYLRNMGDDAILPDENARPHRARLVHNLLEREGITRMDWPACSPDHNPTEHQWEICISDNLYNELSHKSIRCIIRAWTKFSVAA